MLVGVCGASVTGGSPTAIKITDSAPKLTGICHWKPG